MREEIGKFRGKRLDNGEWIYGDYVRFPRDSGSWMEPPSQEEDHFITNRRILSRDMMEVDPSTVGEFTGLKDKNGVEIYEGDVVDCCRNGDEERIVRISIDDIRTIPTALFGSNLLWREVIGNIHDNPELLEDIIAKAREGKANG